MLCVILLRTLVGTYYIVRNTAPWLLFSGQGRKGARGRQPLVFSMSFVTTQPAVLAPPQLAKRSHISHARQVFLKFQKNWTPLSGDVQFFLLNDIGHMPDPIIFVDLILYEGFTC